MSPIHELVAFHLSEKGTKWPADNTGEGEGEREGLQAQKGPLLVPSTADPCVYDGLACSHTLASDTNFPCRYCIGSLQFASISTKIDFSYSVSHAVQSCETPKIPHLGVVKRILKYFHGSPGLRIAYSAQCSIRHDPL